MIRPLMSLAAALTLTSLQLVASPHGVAQELAVQAPPITIEAIEATGAGCPAGSVIPLPIDSDAKGQALTLKLTEYTTYVGPQTSIDQKACELHIYINVPAGYATAVTTVIYRGLANLDSGVSGELAASYRWLGRAVRAKSKTPKRLVGTKAPFEFVDTIEGAATSQSAHEDQLVISTNLSLVNSSPIRRTGELKLERTELDLTSNIVIKFETTPLDEVGDDGATQREP